MHPIKFNPILKSTLWGGGKIIPFKQLKGISQPQIGESWEISNVPGNDSIVSIGPDAGKSLTELLKTYKSNLVGKDNYRRFGNTFPLLVKFIDAGCVNGSRRSRGIMAVLYQFAFFRSLTGIIRKNSCALANPESVFL